MAGAREAGQGTSLFLKKKKRIKSFILIVGMLLSRDELVQYTYVVQPWTRVRNQSVDRQR